MVDSRDKGVRAEYNLRDRLRKHTGLQWERVPGSGGFNAVHGLKGDLYIPDTRYRHCIEVKHYKDDVFNSNLMNETVSTLEKFWQQTRREADEINKEPLLVFRKDRGKWLVATIYPELAAKEITITFESLEEQIYIYLLEDWLLEKTTEDFLVGL